LQWIFESKILAAVIWRMHVNMSLWSYSMAHLVW